MQATDNKFSAVPSASETSDSMESLSTQTKQFIFGTSHMGSQLETQTKVKEEISQDQAVTDELKGYLEPTQDSQQEQQTDDGSNQTEDSKAKESTESFDAWAFEIQDSRFARKAAKDKSGKIVEESQQTVTSSEMHKAEEIAGPYMDGKKVVRFNMNKNEVCTQQIS